MKFVFKTLFLTIYFFNFFALFSMEEGVINRKRKYATFLQDKPTVIDLNATVTSYIGNEPATIEQPYGKLNLKNWDPIRNDTFGILLKEANEENIPLHVVLVTAIHDSKQQIWVYELFGYLQSQLGNNFLHILSKDELFSGYYEFTDPLKQNQKVSLLLVFRISPKNNQATFLGYIPGTIDRDVQLNRQMIESITQCAWKEYKGENISQIRFFLKEPYKKKFKSYVLEPSLFTLDVWKTIMRKFRYAFSKDVRITSEHDIKMLTKILKYTIYFALISQHIGDEDFEFFFNTWQNNQQYVYNQCFVDWNEFLKYFAYVSAIHERKYYSVTCLTAYDPDNVLDKALVRAKIMFILKEAEAAKKYILEKFDNTEHPDYQYAHCVHDFIVAQAPDNTHDVTEEFFKKFPVEAFCKKIALDSESEILETDINEARQHIFVLCADILFNYYLGKKEPGLMENCGNKILAAWGKLQDIIENVAVPVDEQFNMIARIARMIEKIKS